MAYPSFVGCDLGGDQPTGYAIPSACFHTPEITITHPEKDALLTATGGQALPFAAVINGDGTVIARFTGLFDTDSLVEAINRTENSQR